MKTRYLWIGYGLGGPYVLEHPPSSVDERAFEWIRVRICNREKESDRLKLTLATSKEQRERWVKRGLI